MKRKRLLSFLSILLFLFSVGIYGTISFNYSECTYVECSEANSGSISSIQSGEQIRFLIVTGAGHFLKSNSDFHLFLNKIELSELYGVNFDELRIILNSIIASMENCKDTYFELKNLAAITPYIQTVIYALKVFDYDGFYQEMGNLNPKVYQDVKFFLGTGNVTGSYGYIYSKTVIILELLYCIKHDIDKNVLPSISTLWKINQIYSNSLSFGQYVSMIFRAL